MKIRPLFVFNIILFILATACSVDEPRSNAYMSASAYDPDIYVTFNEVSSNIVIYNSENKQVGINNVSNGELLSFATLPPLIDDMKFESGKTIALGKSKAYIHKGLQKLELDITFCYKWNPDMIDMFGGSSLFVSKIEAEGQCVNRDIDNGHIIITLYEDKNGIHLSIPE